MNFVYIDKTFQFNRYLINLTRIILSEKQYLNTILFHRNLIFNFTLKSYKLKPSFFWAYFFMNIPKSFILNEIFQNQVRTQIIEKIEIKSFREAKN